MRLSIFFVFFVTSMPFVTPIAVLTVLELSEKVIEIVQSLLDTWNQIEDHPLVDTIDQKKEMLVFSKLDDINLQMSDINEQLHNIGDDINIIVRMLNSLPNTIRLELQLHDIRTRQIFLDVYYKDMEKYVMDFHQYENSTLLKFADNVVSGSPNSVPFLMKVIYEQVTRRDFLELFYKTFGTSATGFFCKETQSLAQIFHSFLNEIVLVNTKSYILTEVAYMIKKLYRRGSFTREIKDATEQFITRTNNLIAATKPYMAKASPVLWRCDPTKHVKDETYVEITNFLQGYILNKVNLDPQQRCRDECNVFKFTKTQKCNGNRWCEKQTTCPKVVDCQYVDSSMKVCSTPRSRNSTRRYEYIEYGSGRTFGKKKACRSNDLSYLQTYISWVIYRCSYCFCLCDEGPKRFSDRYINLRLAAANTSDNRVVTGLRFVKHNQIIHLQVQEGKLLPNGQIDLDTVQWVPPEDYRVTDRNISNSQDFHTLSWEERGFDLADIKAQKGYVVTGVRFRKVGTRLHLEVLTTPFNLTTGKLKRPDLLSFFEDDPDMAFKHKFPRELKLVKPDVPTVSKSGLTDHTTNKFVQFTYTDFDKDAAQTTVPFLDSQPVASAIPVPLSGVGIFHVGKKGSGGFIAPRIFTYNLAQHFEPLPLLVDKKGKLRNN